MFAVTILGNNSALPAYGRFPTAQVVTLNEQAFLIDCGEGTQIQMSKYKIRRSKINHIFISHLHGDHYFGLVGLITSMGLLGRENDLHLYAPAPLKQILDIQFTVADTRLPFTLHFHALENEGLVVDDKKFTVECFKTQHRIECWGFIIREKKQPRKINKEKIKEYTIPTTYYERLKNGDDYQTKDGDIIKNEILTIANTLAKSYAFCADTIYDESLVDKVANVSLLYHETTYLKDLEDRATDRFHSTTVQAASIAKKANVNKLLIGHFSSKYEQLDIFEQEAKEVFANTQLAIDGVTFLIK
ncbi:MAG: ribonuclease Z [Bacteroidetes bacterium]|nr:ribonuclease Z [Bacteroidota bacterium]